MWRTKYGNLVHNTSKLSKLLYIIILFILLIKIYNTNANTTLVIRVLDADNKPLSGATVVLAKPPPDSYIISSGVSDTNGYVRFSLNNPPDKIDLYVMWRDVLVYSKHLSPFIGSIIINAKVGDIVIKVLSTSGNSLSDVKVTLVWRTNTGLKSMDKVTNIMGEAIFKDMPLIYYNVTLTMKGYPLLKSKIDARISRSFIFKVNMYRLDVYVLDSSGYGLSNARVKLIGDGKVINKICDKQGHVSFGLLKEANYTIEVSYLDYHLKRKIYLLHDLTLNIVINNLSKYPVKIIVKDSSGRPLPHIKINIRTLNDYLVAVGYTDQYGIFITNIYPGTYILGADYNGKIQNRIVKVSENINELTITYYIPEKNSKPTSGYNPIQALYSVFFNSILFIIFVIVLIVFIFIVAFHYIMVSKRIL